MNTSGTKTILVTGASGFIGQHAVPFFKNDFIVKTISLRSKTGHEEALENTDVILFLTGIAHQMKNTDEKLYYDVNRDLALSFASKAKKAGVKHFIYISSVKVYGEGGTTSYQENSLCQPADAYGHSKLEAENLLKELADHQFIISIIRPAVIYGHGSKGNIRKIINLVRRLPVLPFKGIDNKRSLIYIENLLTMIRHIIDQQESGIFLAADDARSTSEIVSEINKNIKKPKPLIHLPSFMKFLIRRAAPSVHQRLFENFILNNEITKRRLNYTPPVSFSEGIKRTIGITEKSLKAIDNVPA